MRRANRNPHARRAALDFRSIILTLVAFAVGLLLWNVGANMWQEKMADAVKRISKDSEREWAEKFKPIETPKFDSSDVTKGIDAGLYHPDERR